MSPSANSPLALIGNPENRRIQDYKDTLRRLGQAEPLCYAYEDLLCKPQPIAAAKVRLDSPGENARVAQLLIERGGGPADVQLEHGEIAYLQEYHRGFCGFLKTITGRCLNSPAEIASMFDKWECHQRFQRAGLARPSSQLASPEMLKARSGRLFLKPLHGSSASGVCALRWTQARRQLIAPLRIHGSKLFNSLKVRTYTVSAEIDFILNQLLPQGMIAEEWIPKLSLPGGLSDLRILVVAGRARHRVLRQSFSPMTNLHLGNRRGDPDQVDLEPALELAEKAAACFPGALYAGVDILLDYKGRPLVGEINAFGDLLPNLSHEGESAYEAIIRSSL